MNSPKAAAKHYKQYRRLGVQFADQVKAWQAAEQQGAAVLSSVANILQRIPVLTSSDSSVLGVLQKHTGAGSLLLQKHYQELEKLMEYLPLIMCVQTHARSAELTWLLAAGPY